MIKNNPSSAGSGEITSHYALKQKLRGLGREALVQVHNELIREILENRHGVTERQRVILLALRQTREEGHLDTIQECGGVTTKEHQVGISQYTALLGRTEVIRGILFLRYWAIMETRPSPEPQSP